MAEPCERCGSVYCTESKEAENRFYEEVDHAPFREFTGEEIFDHLAEAIWGHERSPETSVWLSFWDRILEGVSVPEMPAIDPDFQPGEGD